MQQVSLIPPVQTDKHRNDGKDKNDWAQMTTENDGPIRKDDDADPMEMSQKRKKNPEIQKIDLEPKDADIGEMLKSAYRETLDEEIPQDLLDLLKKLK